MNPNLNDLEKKILEENLPIRKKNLDTSSESKLDSSSSFNLNETIKQSNEISFKKTSSPNLKQPEKTIFKRKVKLELPILHTDQAELNRVEDSERI